VGTDDNKNNQAPEGRKKSEREEYRGSNFFRPLGASLDFIASFTHGSRRGLHSAAAFGG
jgi:hypothetical protein